MHSIGDVLQVPMDKFGISVIDYQNNGNPGSFAALARALGYPWAMTCDKSPQGASHRESVKGRGFSDEILNAVVFQLPFTSLEEFCIDHGFDGLAEEVAGGILGKPVAELGRQATVDGLQKHKVAFASRLAERLRAAADGANRVPDLYRQLFAKLEGWVK